MAYGVEIQNTSGLTRLTVTDFIHTLVQSGVATGITVDTTTVFVPVTGMTDSDQWAVVSTYNCSYTLSAGGFYLTNGTDGGYFTSYNYSVYRR